MALLEFYGTECPHCDRMHILAERLVKEAHVMIERYEVWHNKENAKKMEEYDKNLCGGVPFFYTTKNKQVICGETSYENLHQWAQGT